MEKEENMSETVKTIIYAIVIAVLIRSFLFEPFKIPSGSMYPNLYVGDFLFVSKYTYGYSRHSFPFSFPPFEGRIWSSEPKQGDVVVFKFPKDNRTDFIKRIIGMPGDRIKLETAAFLSMEKCWSGLRARTLCCAILSVTPSVITSIRKRCPTG